MLEVREREVCTSKASLYCHTDNNKSTGAGHGNPFVTQTPPFPPQPEYLLRLWTLFNSLLQMRGCGRASSLELDWFLIRRQVGGVTLKSGEVVGEILIEKNKREK